MRRLMVFLAVSGLACAGAKDKDVEDSSPVGGDDSGDTDITDGVPLITEIRYDCDDGDVCTWTVEADGAMGDVQLFLAGTGDESGACESHPNCSDEGFWTETHDDFDAEEVDGGTHRRSITLDIVGAFEDQAANQSTLLDMGNGSIEANVTYVASLENPSGLETDCWSTGDDPSYVSECAD
jgi:hypothetical protein